MMIRVNRVGLSCERLKWNAAWQADGAITMHSLR